MATARGQGGPPQNTPQQNQTLINAINTLTASLNTNNQRVNLLSRHFLLHQTSITALGGTIATSVKDLERVQKASLAIGKTSTILQKENTEAINRLGVGPITTLSQAVMLQEEGLRSISDKMLELAVKQDLTNQNSVTAAKLSKSLITQGLATKTQRDELIKTLFETSQSYGVRSDRLADSLTDLSEALTTPALLGVAPNIVKGVELLTARLGTEFGGQINQFIKELLKADPSERLITGTAPLVKAMLDGSLSAKEQAKLITQAFTKIAQFGDRFVSTAKQTFDPLFVLENLLSITGQQLTTTALQLAHAEKNFAEEQSRTTQDFRNSLEGQFKVLVGGIQRLVSSTFPWFIDNFRSIISIGFAGSIASFIWSQTRNTNALRANTAALRTQGAAGAAGAGAGAVAGRLGFLSRLGLAGLAISTVVGLGLALKEYISEDQTSNLVVAVKENTKAIKEQNQNKDKVRDVQSMVTDKMLAETRYMDNIIRKNLFQQSDNSEVVELLREILTQTKLTQRNTKERPR